MDITSALCRDKALAAPLVSATPILAVICISASLAKAWRPIMLSPPKRWEQPVTSRISPSGTSNAIQGESLSAHRRSARNNISSRTKSEGSVRRLGQIARASAADIPSKSPASRASCVRWVRRNAFLISVIIAKAVSRRGSPRRAWRSSGSCGNHMDIMRRIFPFPPSN